MANISIRNDSVRIRVSCGYDERGKQIVRSKTWKPDGKMTPDKIKSEAIKKAQEFEQLCKGSTALKKKPFKFGVLMNEWLDDYAEANLKRSTLTHQRLLAKRTHKAIGHIRVDKITSCDVQNFIDSLAKSGQNLNTGGCLSKKTLTHYRSFVSCILDYAIKQGMLNDNPCKNVKVPKGRKKKRELYTTDELKHLIDLLYEYAPRMYIAFFLLAIYTGMRRGELLGLEWKDIDFNAGTIHISRISGYTKVDGAYTDSPKTEGSDRIVLINEGIIEALSAYKEEQDEQKAALGNKWVDSDRLFAGYTGKPLGLNTPYNWLKRFCKKHEISFYGLHEFRHMYASIAMGSGIDVLTVSKNMGHSQCSTTLNIYCHAISQNQIDSRTKFDKALPLPSKILKS